MIISSRIEQLTGLRFIAALGVLLSHYHGLLQPLPELKFIFDLGGHGVTLFFILSGFVLTLRYERDSHSCRTDIHLTSFAVARFARIVPVYWLSLLLTLFAYWASGFTISLGPGPGSLTAAGFGFGLNWMALQAWVPDESVQQYWNAPGWSISVELFFYACFPLLIRIKSLSGSLRSFGAVFLIFLAALLVYFCVLIYIDRLSLLMLIYGSRLPLFGLYSFIFGILICRRLRAQGESWARPTMSVSLAALALLVVAWLMARIEGLINPEATLMIDLLVRHCADVPLMAIIIAGIAQDTKFYRGLLGNSWLVLLGNASYALYLLHWLPLGYLLNHNVSPGVAPMWIALIILSLVMMSVFVYRWFESPFRLWIIEVAHQRTQRRLERLRAVPIQDQGPA